MKVVHNLASPAVTKVVTVSPEKPETFDLIGLSFDQLARLYVLVGNATGQLASGESYPMFNEIQSALGLQNWPSGLSDFTACVTVKDGARIRSLTGRS